MRKFMTHNEALRANAIFRLILEALPAEQYWDHRIYEPMDEAVCFQIVANRS